MAKQVLHKILAFPSVIRQHIATLSKPFRSVFLFVFLALVYTSNAQYFSALNVDGISIAYYITSEDLATVNVAGCTHGTTHLDIPDSVTYNGVTYTVTGINAYAFMTYDYYGYPNSTLVSVIIPSSVSSIGLAAFHGCINLVSVTFPNTLTVIGDEAFGMCSRLSSVTLPRYLTTIGSYAFQGCSEIDSIVIPNFVTSIGEGAFLNCSKLSYVSWPSTITTLGVNVFAGCGFTTFTVPSFITSIGGSAFANCDSLESIVIPNSVSSIGGSAFAGCDRLRSVTIPASVTTINYGTFSSCDSLVSVSLPSTITYIGEEAFYRCRKLSSIAIPDAVRTIDELAFCGCTNLSSISFSSSSDLRSIGRMAFRESGLTSIDFPPALTNIGYDAFSSCNRLTTITFQPGSVITTIGEAAFPECINLSSVSLPNTVTSIQWWAFKGCRSLTSFTFPPYINFIGESAFRDCSGLTSIHVPSSVNTLEQCAFINCTSLDSAFIDASIRGLNNSIFEGCTNLTYVSLPSSTINYIGARTFQYCYNLSTIISPYANDFFSTLESIGESAFAFCYSLPTIEISPSMDYYDIEESAFYHVKHINYQGNSSRAPWGALSMNDYVEGDLVFSDQNKTTILACFASATSVAIPATVNSIADYAFYWCKQLSTVNIPTNSALTTIGYGAFQNCSNLTNITLPDSLESLGIESFAGCYSLTSINLPAALNSIGWSSFASCHALDSLIIKSSCDIPYDLLNGFWGYMAGGRVDYVEVHQQTPPNISYNEILYGISDTAHIYVPCAAINSYRNHDYWYRFSNYHSLDRAEMYDTIQSCGSYTWIDGNTYITDTVVSYSLPNTTCENVVTLSLTIQPTYQHADTIILCDNMLPYTYGDTTLISSGNYDIPFNSMLGCDSIITLMLFVNSTDETILSDTVCQSGDYAEYGFSVTDVQASETLTQELSTVNGCDSTVTLFLTMNTTAETMLHDTVCQGNDYTNYGFSVTDVQASDTLTLSLSTVNGCDSTVLLCLTVLPSSQTVLHEILCQGSDYNSNGFTVTDVQAGDTLVQTLATWQGCDSTVTLVLTMALPMETTLYDTVCQGSDYAEYGFSLTDVQTSDTLTQELTTWLGCDSTVSLILTVVPIAETVLYDTVCQGSDYAVYGFSLTDVQTSDTLTQELTTWLGCDSTVTLLLTVIPTYSLVIDDTVARGESYTEHGFELSDLQESGTFTQELSTLYGCDSIITLNLTVQEVGIEAIEKDNGIAVMLYPNPADERVTLQVDALSSEAQVMLYDAQGRTVLSQTLQAGEETLMLNVSHLTAGSYHVRIVSNNKTVVRKLIKM